MNLWKCHYFVSTGYGIMEMEDYIWAVNKPDVSSIGHYWKTLFPHYTVTGESCQECQYYDGMNLDVRCVARQATIK